MKKNNKFTAKENAKHHYTSTHPPPHPNNYYFYKSQEKGIKMLFQIHTHNGIQKKNLIKFKSTERIRK